MSRAILHRALPLIPQLGFTRHAISTASADAPLSETAISALFGKGDDARRALIRAWLDAGRKDMADVSAKVDGKDVRGEVLEDVLLRRLEWNVPVLPHLKEVSVTVFTNGFM